MKKSDLKNGMVVEYRDGKKRIIDNNGELLDKILIPCASISGYKDDLSHTVHRAMDIAKIYDNVSAMTKNDIKPIWKRVIWEKVEVDSLVLVSNNTTCPILLHEKRHFAKYDDNKIYTYPNGKTSWSTEDCESLEIWSRFELQIKEKGQGE